MLLNCCFLSIKSVGVNHPTWTGFGRYKIPKAGIPTNVYYCFDPAYQEVLGVYQLVLCLTDLLRVMFLP